MATRHPMLQPEIGPDGLPREAPVIAYTEKIIEEEQLQLKRYIEENYSKIRDVEREFANLNFEMKLTSGPKKAALEHMRKKIEMSTERIRLARIKEEQARKVWEQALAAVKEEEAVKQKLCEDLNQLVQESSNIQFARLEELKRRLEALNPSRASSASPRDGQLDGSAIPLSTVPSGGAPVNTPNQENGKNVQVTNMASATSLDEEGKSKKKIQFHGRGRGVGAVPKGRVPAGPGWTGSGFDVDGRS